MKMQSFLRFPGFLLRACTLSYDDGRDHDMRLLEIMRKYGLRGTFNLTLNGIESPSSDFIHADYIKEHFGADAEIALHGCNHLSLSRVTPPLAMRDVATNREAFEKIFGKIIRGMAYANGAFDDETVELLRTCGVAYSRTTRSTESFDIPEEWLLWHPTCHHKNPNLFELIDKFFEEPRAYFWSKSPRIFYLWGHSYEFANDGNWDVIERFGAEMAKHDDVWHATNIEIYEYIEAFKRLEFSLDMSIIHNPTATDIYLNLLNKDVLVKAGETVTL